MNKIDGAVILITGASGGIGLSLVKECVARGAKKIYATDLGFNKLQSLQKQYPDIVVPYRLDVTQVSNVIECHSETSDVNMIINNAGVECATRFSDENALKAAQFEMAVNYHGVHNMCSTYWDTLISKQSAAIVNILSVASFTLILKLGTYCASKSAAHFLTQALRNESEGTNLKVIGVYPGYVDTEMTKNINVEKVTPEQIALKTCDGIEMGELTIFPDPMARSLAQKLEYQNHIYAEFDK